MVQDDSHSTLRASAFRRSRRSNGTADFAMAFLARAVRFPMLILLARPYFSIFYTFNVDFGIFYHISLTNPDFIPMPALDANDRKNLGYLQADDRNTKQQHADKDGQTVSPC